MQTRYRRVRGGVSPEFILRPSLSGCLADHPGGAAGAGVAGVYAPAFVERMPG